MSKILVTHCGRNGDCLWGMATARALAEQAGAPVDLILPGQYAGLAPLLAPQPYLGTVMVDEDWVVQQSAPITPRSPAIKQWMAQYDQLVNLGYESWPTPDVARDPARRCGVVVDLGRPWITVADGWTPGEVGCAVGFTDEWFELKFGVWELITKHRTIYPDGWIGNWQSISGVAGSRWRKEGKHYTAGWEEAAQVLAGSRVFLGCCSALHVLAVAMGIPAVVLEPNPHRHNAIFYPVGTTGPQVTLVLGGDGQPTHDVRHCWDTVKAVLEVARG